MKADGKKTNQCESLKKRKNKKEKGKVGWERSGEGERGRETIQERSLAGGRSIDGPRPA